MDKQENETQFPIESEFNQLNISDKDSNPINANDKNCSYCNKPFIEKLWCKECDPYDIIEGWTSGNPDIDKLIKDTMYNARYHNYKYFLEWVPFDRFTDVNQIGEGGFAKVYSAIWMDGKANYKYDYGSWKKLDPKPMRVTLKRLYESQNMSIEYLNELKIHWDVYLKENSLLDFYGITSDPETKEFMLITKFAGYGSLRNILLSYFHNILWKNKIRILGHLTLSLKNTHKSGYFHKNLHSGNITIFQAYHINNPYFATIIPECRYVNSYISDFGLSGPANKQKSDNKIYGILPYIAPEVLNGEPYTKSSDIYSFGVIMAELSSGNPPFHDRKHDLSLALDICNGFRPEFGKGTPEIYKSLAYKCMNANPTQRPKADELNKILLFWCYSIYGEILSYKGRKIRYAFQMADEEMQNISISFEEGTMYTSKVFTFNNLPKPVNLSAINTYLEEDMDINKDLSSCSYCNKLFTTEELWCNECDPHGIIEGWTSGNLDIDKFIKDTMHLRRYNERNRLMFLEWVPFDRFTDVKQIGKGGFSEVYSATLIDYFEKKHDPMMEMAPGERAIKLDCGSMKMALKRLNGSQNMSADYLNKLKTHWNILLEDKYGLLKTYGLTRDPKTKEFMIVLPFVGGSLREILSNNFKTLNTFDKLGTLSKSILQLAKLHNLGYSHKNFHSGNILGITTDDGAIIDTFISDFGLSGPANEQISDNKIYGVLPYIAPEVLNGEAYTKSSDIYSFGIIMTEVSSGKPPFFDRKHDANLALAICNGSRPEFGEGTPELYKKIACMCMNANPNERLTAGELFDALNTWNLSLLKLIMSNQKKGSFGKEYFFAGVKDISTSYDKDPDAIYTSRAFTFNNLPKPVNSSFIKAYLVVEEEDDNDVGDEH